MGVCGVPRPGFFVYALAYGVNKGLLSADKFMPVIEKGWNALLSAFSPSVPTWSILAGRNRNLSYGIRYFGFCQIMILAEISR